MRKRIRRLWRNAKHRARRVQRWARRRKDTETKRDRWRALTKFAERRRKLSERRPVRRTWRRRRKRWRGNFVKQREKFLRENPEPQPHPAEGVSTFDGKPVASWWVVILSEARRKHGWQGGLTSGWRSPEYSRQLCQQICGADFCAGRCAGTTSNHVRTDEGAAVDVSDPEGFARALRVMGRPEYNALAANGDPWHFSRSGR